jgi:hypothetical protein
MTKHLIRYYCSVILQPAYLVSPDFVERERERERERESLIHFRKILLSKPMCRKRIGFFCFTCFASGLTNFSMRYNYLLKL